MSSPQAEIIPAQFAPASQTTLYTSTALVTRIDKLTVTNNGTTAATISINLVAAGGSASAANRTTNAQAIAPGQTWNSPNEYGHYLMPGDAISVVASAATTLTIAAGGTQIS